RSGKRIGVNLQPQIKRGLRAYAGTDASKPAPLNCLMKLERVTPESFIAKGIEAKRVLTFLHHPLRISADLSIELLDFRLYLYRGIILGPAPVKRGNPNENARQHRHCKRESFLHR